ncbi:MAG TPA: nuclear transport factor 2 family protein [Solirubrobacteraceae bacterium]
MDEAVARFCAASRSKDIDGMIATLAPDAELVSPISGHLVFRGVEDVRFLLGAVYNLLTDVEWERDVGDGQLRLALSRAKIGGIRVTDAMVFELDDQGRIWRIRPHLRPWLALSVFALLVGPKVARRPDAVRRALRTRWR